MKQSAVDQASERGETVYAIGDCAKPRMDAVKFVMWWGPSLSLDDALQEIGDNNSFIIAFCRGDKTPLYHWEDNSWVKIGDHDESQNLHVKSVGIRRRGGENDPNAEVVLEIQLSDGRYVELGSEKINANFSSWWNLDRFLEDSQC